MQRIGIEHVLFIEGIKLLLAGGVAFFAVWHFAGQPFGIVPFWPGCGTGLVILVVMTALNGKKVSDDYARYKALMDAVPANEL